ncbi:universal stress protein [Thiobacillus sp.]|uniref:universal stress protein n=1 Tax=Thiobacillus sp. TaxID=924 RepID=UPI0025FFB35C|nr:universal stress protein [Thiobacillus sp.]
MPAIVDTSGIARNAAQYGLPLPESEGRIHAAAHEAMEAFIGTLRVPARQLTPQFVHGAATLRILEHEQTMDADLIVMGKHGQSVMEELLLGSVTQHVLKHSSSDVLIAGHTG